MSEDSKRAGLANGNAANRTPAVNSDISSAEETRHHDAVESHLFALTPSSVSWGADEILERAALAPSGSVQHAVTEVPQRPAWNMLLAACIFGIVVGSVSTAAIMRNSSGSDISIVSNRPAGTGGIEKNMTSDTSDEHVSATPSAVSQDRNQRRDKSSLTHLESESNSHPKSEQSFRLREPLVLNRNGLAYSIDQHRFVSLAKLTGHSDPRSATDPRFSTKESETLEFRRGLTSEPSTLRRDEILQDLLQSLL